jgi:hypothetical protein
MSDSFGGAKRGKTANSSDIAALKRKLATAKTYTEQPLNRVFKSASDVMSLGIVNNTLQAQTYITTGAAFDIYNQLTGKIIYEGQLTGQPVDYQALLALLSAKLGIPASNLKVSVKAGSVIIEWSTLSPIIKTYTPPDVRAIVTTLLLEVIVILPELDVRLPFTKIVVAVKFPPIFSLPVTVKSPIILFTSIAELTSTLLQYTS